jgi:hypothetical protein
LLAVVGVYLHRQSDRRKKQDELIFQVYMRLFDLHGRHFWIYSQESSGRQSDLRPGVRLNRVRWRMADLLRQVDSLPELPAILHAMLTSTASRAKRNGTKRSAGLWTYWVPGLIHATTKRCRTPIRQ